MSTFREILKLPDTFTKVLYNTRLNDKVLSIDTRGKKVGSGYFKNGHEITPTKEAGVYKWISFTVEGGVHRENFNCTVDSDCKLISGKANTFAFGWMAMDQEYVDSLLNEMADGKFEWDELI